MVEPVGSFFPDVSIGQAVGRIAQGVALFARLVPVGEIMSGVAMVLGFWTPLFAFVAFFMALSFQLASGSLFHYSFLTSGYATRGAD